MLYHLSVNAGKKVLKPRVPMTASSLFEDTTTKRVCFSNFIRGCLSSLQQPPEKYYVYVPNQEINEADIHYPTVDEVMDAEINHEIWVMNDVKVKCIGIIQAENYDWNVQLNTSKGEVTFFHYPYKWIEMY